ncbi:MAG TPA: carboxypeptidase regulatory-like domain-containing protein [Geobacteraceae bacterium]
MGFLKRSSFLVLSAIWCLALLVSAAGASDGRFLAKDDIILYGMQLTAAPATQTVPKNIATIVSTFLQVPTMPEGQIPPLAPDATVKATLRGPGLETPLELSVQANTPFTIPPLTVPGTYSLDGIRLESGGEVLFYGTPESVKIEVIEKLLVTQVTARPLSADEIREKGIVFDKNNFQAYNFTAAFAVAPGKEVNINMPVILPKLQGTSDEKVDGITIPSIQGAQIKTLSTIIPDSLKLASTKIPNLSVQSFKLEPDIPKGNDFVLPPIPGVVVIPGDIGFLNQYFSVMLMVGNAAPLGSGLVVKDLRAQIILPPGNDEVVNTPDDPLRMAMTNKGESPRNVPVAKPGPDGKLGTGDDINELAPGETGNAEFLVEGRREGSHTVEMEITGTLYGLPVGPVPVRGRAMGTVLVRNPTFTMTFTHPDLVTAGEHYNLDVTVTNTSDSPANFVSINLYPRYISGATLAGDPVRTIDSIPAGDSATVSYELVPLVSGNVFAATLDSDEQIKGKFLLKTSVGELGIPLSPDSLVLPAESANLPKGLRDAVIGLLGKAYATATAPAAALPKDVIPFGKRIVWDRGIEAAEAGMRLTLHEALPDNASQLLMDYVGSNVTRIPQLYDAGEQQSVTADFAGFDDLRRRSVRGDVFAAAVAGILGDELEEKGAAAFQRDLATRLAYRPRFVSVLAEGEEGLLPVAVTLVDASGKRLGGTDAKGKVTKEIPYSDYLLFNDSSGSTTATMALLAAPADGALTVKIEPLAGSAPDAPYTLTIVYPDASGNLQQATWPGLTPGGAPSLTLGAGDPVRISFDAPGTPVAAAASETIPDLAPTVLGVVQQPRADLFKCDEKDPGKPLGRVVAMLFSEEVSPDSVQDKVASQLISNYAPEENQVVGVALQPGRRIAFIALRDPIGPFVARSITVNNVSDLRGHSMTSQTVPMEATIEIPGAVVSGRILKADGALVAGAEVRLILQTICPGSDDWVDVGISSKHVGADAHYQWDYAEGGPFRIKEVAVDPDTNDVRRLIFSVARNAQRLNADIVFLGRGTVQGRAFGEDGVTPLKDVHIKVTNLVDQTEYGAITGDDGRYTINRVPIGNSILEAVHTGTNSHVTQSVYIGNSGAVVEVNLVLLSEAVKKVQAKYGHLSGNVLRPDGTSPVAGVPVIAYYQNNSQPGVYCPCVPTLGGCTVPTECAVAMAKSDSSGAYDFPSVVAGDLHLYSFDQAVYQQGNIFLPLPADGEAKGNILLQGGFATIRGTVLDADGKPVANAQVGGGLALTTSDANGNYELKDVPIGHANLVAVSQALGASGTAQVDLVRDGEVANATIVLSAIGGVYGTVLRPDGTTPAGGIDVFALMLDPNGDWIVVGSTTTDAAGRYQIKPLAVNTGDGYYISAFLPDLSDGNIVSHVRVLFNGHQVKSDVVFKGRGRVEGVIYDDDGQTPLKARVSVSALTVESAPGPGGKLVGIKFMHVQHLKIVDNDFTTGKFSFDNVFVGPIVITAGGAFSPDPVTFADFIEHDGETRQVVLKLQPTSVITGQVFQPDGFTPVGEAVKVTFKSDEFKTICTSNGGEDSCQRIPQGIQEENVYTLPDGTFKVPLVNAGEFTLTALDPVTGKTAQLKGHVAAGQTAEIKMRLLAKADVTVKVFGSDGSTPIIGARVTLERGSFPKAKVTGSAVDGTITFTGIDEGAFAVFAEDLSRGFTGRANAQVVKDGQGVTVNVYLYDATGTVYGTVYRPDGITPVPNADIAIFNAQGVLAFNVTDANGQYRQDTIPLGGVTVNVFEAATGRRGGGSGNIDFSGEEVPIVINEAAIGHVRGYAYDAATMQPLRAWEARLSVTFPDGSALTLVATTGTDGSFFFPGIPQGPFTVEVSREKVGKATVQGVIGQENELIELPVLVNLLKPSLGSINAVVLYPNGTPAPSYTICLDPYQNICARTMTAGSDGTVLIDDLALGRHVLIASSQVTASKGSALAEIAFAGSATVAKIIVDGLGTVSPVVVWQDQTPANGVQLLLEKSPDAGCGSHSCALYADANGTATFESVPPGTYTVYAIDPVHALSGAASGTLHVGESATPRLVLEVNGTVQGSALYPDGVKRSGIIVELTDGEHTYFQATDAEGAFALRGIKTGSYTLNLTDPLGSGMGRKSLVVNGIEDVGTIILDDAPPQVVTINPLPGGLKIPLAQQIVITFSEPVQPGSLTPVSVTLSDGSASLTGTIAAGDGNTTATFTPVAPLKEQTVYTVRVDGILDNLGRPMAKPFVSTFTTVDLTPPAPQSIDPAPGTSGLPLESVVRIVYNEPIDASAFSGAAITLSRGGVPVAGRVDPILGNTGLVFTPTYPLVENGQYHVEVQPATDLSGNRQATGLSYDFSALDRTPPVISALTPSNDGNVIEGDKATISANVGSNSDVAFVDFMVNGVIVATDRSGPFELNLQAVSSLGKAGDTILVSAIATDTSGNRGTAVNTILTITPDTPPAVAITAPADGSSFKTGERVNVTVSAADDLGVSLVGYQAVGGEPPAAATNQLASAERFPSRSYAFYVPTDAIPGSTIVVNATAVDTKGQNTKAKPVTLTVLDATPPQVSFSGVSSGNKVKPGQQVTAVVSASDLGGIASLEFRVSGATVYTENRTIDPALNTVATSFTFTVSAVAGPQDTVKLDVTAVDKAGNRTAAAQVVLPVADLKPPQVTLRTLNGTSEMVPGEQVTLVADATDEIGVQRIDVSGSGAFTYSNSKAISPPLGSAQAQFTLVIPPNLADGATLTLSATAVDISGNVSTPATLVLKGQSLTSVTLPASLILNAGDQQQIQVSLGSPAPANGLVVDFASSNAGVAVATSAVIFAGGEQVKQVTVSGVSGGTVQLKAYISGVERGGITVTVNGGIVTGTVYNPYPVAVAGAEVVVNGYSTTTDAAGRFSVFGISGPTVSIAALDRQSGLKGYLSTSMNARNGYLKDVQLQLIPAAALLGTVKQADGTTPAGAGVQVKVFRSGDLSTPLDIVFTDAAGHFEFPLLQIGSYVLDATSAQGERGRASATILQSGLDVNVAITFLGKGTITGQVVDGAGAPAPNPELHFSSYSLFGSDQRLSNGNGDGTFSFSDVFMGDFSITAKDPVTKLSAGTSGKITANAQTVNLLLRLASVGSITGTVYRADGITPAVGATVSAGSASTTSDSQGSYLLETLPLGVYTVTADDPAARSRAQGSATLAVHGETVTRNLTLPAQGSAVVTVVDVSSHPVAGAMVGLSDGYGYTTTLTGADGIVVFDHVQAGSFNITAWLGQSIVKASGSVAAGVNTPVALTLPSDSTPAGWIGGTVFAPDGKTPVAGIRVTNNRNSAGTVSGADGSYRLDNLPLDTYALTFTDQSGLARAKAVGIVLAQDGAGQQVDVSLVGLGSVSGRVLMPDSSSAGSFHVTVRSLNADFGRTVTAITDAAGYYLVERLPVGPFAVSAGDAARQLLGEASGIISADGDTASGDLILQNNAFTPPRTLLDGNLYHYDIQTDGTLASGEQSIFRQSYTSGLKGAASLEVVSGGTVVSFGGDAIGTQEDQARELVLRQQGLAGLNVTRKVFVPLEGYFARYLEILTNPGSAPVTVDLRVKTSFSPGADGVVVISTSSGDNQLDVADPASRDTWAVVDDSNAAQPPAVALVWGGEGATPPTSASFSASAPANLQATWQGITVQPGQTVALLHFVVQQTSRDAAQTAAQRLMQLPPEALSGISGEELAAIVNFAPPADGTSLLEALPPLTGEVTGQVLASDGLTPAPAGTPVTITSTAPLFARSYQSTTDGSGIFRFISNLWSTTPSLGIPVVDFTLKARVTPGSGFDSPLVSGSFAAGANATMKNITFDNTGILSGIVLSHARAPLSGVSVRTVSGLYSRSGTTPPDGSYRFPFLPAGAYTVTVEKGSSQGSTASTSAIAVVTQGSETRLDISFPPLATVSGTVRSASGAAVAGATVTVSSGSFQRSTVSDSTGAFSFVELPAGSYTASTTEPGTGLTATASLTVTEGGAGPILLTFPASGRINGAVSFADGTTTASGVAVQVFDAGSGTLLKSVTTGTGYDTGIFVSDAASFRVVGTLSYAIPGGTRSVSAETTVPGFAGSNATRPANLVLPVNRTSFTATLLLDDGSRYLGDSLTVEGRGGDGTLLATCTTQVASGTCSLANVVVGSDGIIISAMAGGVAVAQQTVNVAASGGSSVVTLTVPVTVATVPVTWYDGNAAPYQVAADGHLTGALNGLFAGSDGGAVALEVVSGGTAQPFAGGRATVTASGAGREVALRQDGIGGLTVIRRIFVPKDGYFVRYLDTFINTGASAATIGVNLRSHLVSGGVLPQLVATSSGDTTPDAAADLWGVFDDTVQDDPFLNPAGNLPPIAVVWQGSGAAQSAATVSYGSNGEFLAGWNNLTIPAGGSVSLLHLVSQQATRGGAQSSATRLALLPPEVLAGLSSADLGTIRNFNAPANGQSTQAALPPLDGTVSGKVVASDGVTLAPAGTPVIFTSANPYFGRGYLTTTAAAGAYSFATALDQGAATVGIVRDSFTVNSSVTIGGVTVPAAATGSFTGGATSVRDIYFTVVPKVTGVTPNQLYANQDPVVIQISGNNFTASSQVLLAGQGLATEFVSATALRATVPLQVSAGAKALAVQNPDPLHPGGYVVSAASTVTVVLPQFTLTPNPLTIRQKGSGTMTVSIPFTAPSGGVAATLTSVDTSVATVPGTVTIPGGSTSATFSVTAPDTSQNRDITVAIHADQNNWLGSAANVTVRPEPTVNLTPTSILSGQGFSFFLTVSLTDPAPAGGLTVNLSSSTANILSLPASVTVAAGATQAQVTVTNTGTGSTVISATAASGSGYSSGDSCAVTVKPVQTYNIGPTLSNAVGILVPAPAGPTTQSTRYTPLITPTVGVVVGRSVSRLIPDRGTIGTQNLTVRVVGTGLDAVSDISFAPATGITVHPGSVTAAADGSYAEVTIDIASDAPVVQRTVVVKSGSVTIAPATAGAITFQVTYQPPQLWSLVPNTGVVGNTVTLQVNGRNLFNASAVTFDPPEGIAVSSSISVSGDGTLASVGITIDPAAAVGKRAVRITTPAGTTPASLSSANGFIILAAAMPNYAQFTAPQVGVLVPVVVPATSVTTRYTPSSSLTVGVSVGGVMTAVVPAGGAIGSNDLRVRVTGSNLGTVNSFAFYPGTGLTVTPGSITPAADGSYVEALVSIAADAPLTVRTVIVKSPSGAVPPAGPGANLFRVTLPQPLIYGISPIRQEVGSNFTLTLNGQLLSGATQVSFLPPDGITVANPPSVSSDGTVATVAVAIAANALVTPRVVTLTTPGGTTTDTPSAANSFTVTSVAGTSYAPLLSNAVGVLVQTPVPPTSRQVTYAPVLSSQVGVTVNPPAPPTSASRSYGPIATTVVGVSVGSVVSGMSPTRTEPGSTVTVTFTGTGLDAVTSLKIAPATTAVTVGTLTPSADGTTLTAQIVADASAPRGMFAMVPMKGTSAVTVAQPRVNLFYVGYRPTVFSISPILQTVGNTFTLTINGTNLDAATTVRFEPADNIVVLNPPSVNSGGTQATVTVVIDGMAAGGQRVVVIEGPYGSSDNTSGANNTFNVSRPSVSAPTSVWTAGRSLPQRVVVAVLHRGGVTTGFADAGDPVVSAEPALRQQLASRSGRSQPLSNRRGDDTTLPWGYPEDAGHPPRMAAMARWGYRGPPEATC